MNDATHGAENIRSDITALSQRYAVVKRDETCKVNHLTHIDEYPPFALTFSFIHTWFETQGYANGSFCCCARALRTTTMLQNLPLTNS